MHNSMHNCQIGTPEFIWKLQEGAETTSGGFGGVSEGYKKILCKSDEPLIFGEFLKFFPKIFFSPPYNINIDFKIFTMVKQFMKYINIIENNFLVNQPIFCELISYKIGYKYKIE